MMKTIHFIANTKTCETIMRLWLILCILNIVTGEARQYAESSNDLFTRPEGRGSRRGGSRMKLLTPDPENAEVLKELGVDLSKEGKPSDKNYFV